VLPAAAKLQQQQQPSWLQIDPAAVQQLHDQLEACHSEAVRDALLEGGQQLLLHISDCFHQGKDNPGFCRQVRVITYAILELCVRGSMPCTRLALKNKLCICVAVMCKPASRLQGHL
jgi:hypothetical protein